MNKVIVTMIGIIVVIGAMLTAIAINQSDNSQANKIENETVAQEKILDDCTDEYEEMQNSNIIVTNSEEEKTSPNCSLIVHTFYKDCEHITEKYNNLPQEDVNLTRKQIEEKYQDYTIESFANNEVVLYQEKEGECGEHYLVKDNEGIVTVYQILKDGTQQEIEGTSISTEYLPETDKVNIKNGIRVNGRQKLNQLIEDFE